MPGGTWCSIRSCADGFLLLDEPERCWSRSTTGSPAAGRSTVHPDETGRCWSGSTTGSSTWSGSPERSRTWSRWTPVGKSRPASSLASHARRWLPRSPRRRSWQRRPPWWSHAPLPACSRRPLLAVGFGRRASAERRVRTRVAVKRHPFRDHLLGRKPVRQLVKIHRFILHTSATARAAR